MSCVAIERLAAAASGEDSDAVAHAAGCVRCGVLLAEQRDAVTAARSLKAPTLSAEHRDELAAELAARLEWRTAASLDEEPRRWGFVLAGVLAVAAAIALGMFATRGDDAPVAIAPPPVARLLPAVAPAPVPPPPPIVVPVPPPRPIVHPPVRRVAPRPVAPIVEAPPPPPPAHDEPASAAAASMLAFRAGWAALRGGRNADAITAFDRATDPAVVEDATFWAAIAADRAGEHTNAQRRLRDFLEQYPQSPHADAARAALK